MDVAENHDAAPAHRQVELPPANNPQNSVPSQSSKDKRDNETERLRLPAKEHYLDYEGSEIGGEGRGGGGDGRGFHYPAGRGDGGRGGGYPHPGNGGGGYPHPGNGGGGYPHPGNGGGGYYPHPGNGGGGYPHPGNGGGGHGGAYYHEGNRSGGSDEYYGDDPYYYPSGNGGIVAAPRPLPPPPPGNGGIVAHPNPAGGYINFVINAASAVDQGKEAQYLQMLQEQQRSIEFLKRQTEQLRVSFATTPKLAQTFLEHQIRDMEQQLRDAQAKVKRYEDQEAAAQLR